MYMQSKVMPSCDLHDGKTELQSSLPKGSQVRWQSWVLYRNPVPLPGVVVELKAKD